MLVTGATGALGRRVYDRAAATGWNTVGTYFAAAEGSAELRLDIRDRAAVDAALRDLRPAAVIHTAAGRDRGDWRSIADGAAHVALAAAAVGARLVHVSSDAIFSGREVHYTEDALPDPTYRYGAAKAAAETAVQAIAPAAVLVRTSTIVGGGRGAHEVLTHALASGARTGYLFTDEIRMPVHVDDLADALLELAATGDVRGPLHVTGPEPVSRHALGLMVAARDGLDPASIPAARSADVMPGRPLDVRLDCTLARSLLRTTLRPASQFMTQPVR
ncbi:sugar nucleotide-binding protein [Dactylosporangium aurantiacum]|uniref:dTDP-4-dehydrorhamnose reductase n=1 Tax=Dactylosporangium aurantiacum TaxID=35754 RepID=A0A9Q9IP55_9ACTN|nr:sugar nucleotide-binding protein [Dactylosporangium aurantiacum]